MRKNIIRLESGKIARRKITIVQQKKTFRATLIDYFVFVRVLDLKTVNASVNRHIHTMQFSDL